MGIKGGTLGFSPFRSLGGNTHSKHTEHTPTHTVSPTLMAGWVAAGVGGASVQLQLHSARVSGLYHVPQAGPQAQHQRHEGGDEAEGPLHGV